MSKVGFAGAKGQEGGQVVFCPCRWVIVRGLS